VDHERGHDDRPPHDPGRVALQRLLLIVLAGAALSAAPAKQTFRGVVTDDMCAREGHAHMRMGPTDAECTTACVAVHGASYVLYDGTHVYTLSDQTTPERYAAQRVAVVGTLDSKTNTIQVKSIAAAK
jgi:hypothetical protein